MDTRIGAQLFTLRDFCQTADQLDESFAKLQKIGYQTAQVSGIGDIPAATVRKIADKYHMELICTHKSNKEYAEHLEQIIADHHTLGCKIAGIGMMPAWGYETREGLSTFIRQFNEIAKTLHENGLQFAYHNHAFEFSKLGGSYIMDALLAETDPQYFHFIVDCYWVAFAGYSPAEFIRKLGSRVSAVHFKDLAVNGFSVEMCEVMEGNLNWDEIIAACDDAGCRYAFVEQDICKGDPFDSMRLSYQNLTKKGFC